MKKIALCVSFMFLVGLFSACSSEETTTQTREYFDVVSLDEISVESTMGTSETTEEETYILDDLIYDFTSHRLNATYEDDYYTINFDVLVRDYGVTETPVYSAEINYQTNTRHNFGSEWSADFELYKLNGVSDEEAETNFASALEYFENTDSMDNRVYSYFRTNNTIISNICVIRSLLNGLPLGEADYYPLSVRRLSYGDYFGNLNIAGSTDINVYLFKSNAIRVIHYDYSNLMETGEMVAVIPLEDCIGNSISHIISSANSIGCGEIDVYYAELIYVPLTIGNESDGYEPVYNPDIRFVPVWALYVYPQSETAGYMNNVYLNALTGEVLEYGLI